MFELPEFVTLARQINQSLPGKVVRQGSLGNLPHKFVWYNRSQAEFEALTLGKTVEQAWAKGKWLFILLEPGYVLVMGECGGKVLYLPPGEKKPEKYHLLIAFEDNSYLTATTQMWGAYELYERGKEQERQYIRGMRPTPIEPGFTFEYFIALSDELLLGEKRSLKSLLTQDQLIPGLGNAIAQDILWQARLHPRRSLTDLDSNQRLELYNAIQSTVGEAIAAGGRYDEVDLYNHPGGYVRIIDKNAIGRPCPRCGATVEKSQYLGGAIYFCTGCQR